MSPTPEQTMTAPVIPAPASWDDPEYWAGIPKQRFLRGNAEGIAGDCWRCSIAAVLGLPAEEVPHFVQMASDSEGETDALTQRWLNERGFTLVVADNNSHWSVFPGWWAPEGGESKALQVPVIECGLTKRTEVRGQHHALVSYRGQMVYDPHPDNSGLTWVTKRYLIIKLWGR